MTLQRCDHDEKQRDCLFKQLIDLDQKSKTTTLTEKMSKNLRELLIGDDKKDMCNVLCCLGNTSHNEANHARIVTRGYHVKGEILGLFFLKNFKRHHDVIFVIQGTPINNRSNFFEAKMAMASIQQNVGYSGLLEEISPNTSLVNSQTIIDSDQTRRRRSQDNMEKVKKNRLNKVYSQEQYKGKGLTQYRGKSKNDENTAPSEAPFCAQKQQN